MNEKRRDIRPKGSRRPPEIFTGCRVLDTERFISYNQASERVFSLPWLQWSRQSALSIIWREQSHCGHRRERILRENVCLTLQKEGRVKRTLHTKSWACRGSGMCLRPQEVLDPGGAGPGEPRAAGGQVVHRTPGAGGEGVGGARAAQPPTQV